ncbi:MAG: beta-ketoacyl-[acyl-carrier-protein] synthase family protein [Planctomycetaceae bacterium]|nr:beta-ketoacyl-[acyl-carrier-protein] synthase family protein [Planctomycetaceae bacterium]
MKRRVVVTGIGLVTPLGADAETVWQRLLRGESGVGMISLFDASSFPTKFAAEVADWDISDIGENPDDWVDRDRNTHFAVGAGVKAFRDSGLSSKDYVPTRFGVYTGAGEGQQNFNDFAAMMLAGFLPDGSFDQSRFIEKGLEILHPIRELEQEPNMPAAHLAALFDAQGPNANCLTACAASSQAIGEATELIRRNEADLMIAGGAHTMIHPFGVTGFNLLTALSTRNDDPQRASRPFDADRDGFVLGEGSAMLILEELEHAKKRNAKIYGEIIGYGSTSDAFRVTDSHPDGRGAIASVRMAIRDAGIAPDEVDYINAHGTSTSVNDRVETLVVKSVFGDQAYKIPMSSTKSMTGHLIAAAGASEMIYSLLAIRDNILPPTINYTTPDPDCDLDYIPNQAREAKCDVIASNSFGFGGQNVTLIARRLIG